MSTQTRNKKKNVPQLADLNEQFVQLKYLQKTTHKAETAVKGSGELLKCLIEKSLVGVYIIQNDKFAYVNSRFARIFGYSQKEITSLESVVLLVSEESRHDVHDNIQRRLGGDAKSIHYTFSGKHKDGRRVECEVLGTRTAFNGEPVIIGTILDTTKQKSLEEALQQNQTRLRLMKSISSGMRARVSTDERIRRTLSAVKGDFGARWLSYCAWNPQNGLSLVHSNAPAGRKERIEELARYEPSSRYLRVLKSGETIVVADISKEILFHPLKGFMKAAKITAVLQVPVICSKKLQGILSLASQKPQQWSSHEGDMLLEIAEYLSIAIKDSGTQQAHKQALNKLRRSEERLRSVIRDIPVMMTVFDANGRIVFWNRECERVSGYKTEEVVENPKAVERLWPDKDARAELLDKFTKERIKFRNWELQLTDKTGAAKTIAWSSIAKRFPITGWESWSVGIDVTEHKQAEASLRISEDKYRTLFEESKDAIYLTSPNGKLLEANAAFLNLFGYSAGEIRKLKVKDLYHATECHKQLLKEMRDNGSVKDFECRLCKKNGDMIVGLLSSTERRSNDGKLIGFQGIVHDITERKRSEEALLTMAEDVGSTTGEEMFRSLVECLATSLNVDFALVGEFAGGRQEPLHTIAVYEKGRIAENFECGLTGTAFTTVAKRKLYAHPEKVQESFPEDVWLRKMGVESSVGIPLCDSGGKILGVLAALHSRQMPNMDFAKSMLHLFGVRAAAELERKRVEAAKHEADEKYRLVVQNANDAILIVQHEVIKFFNPRAMALTGYSADELHNKSFQRLLHPDYRKPDMDCLGKLQGTAEVTIEKTLQLIDRQDRTKWVDVRAVHVTWQGAPARLCFMTDITQKRRLQEELARAQRLESAGRVAGQIAHDFNNLLSPLAAYPGLIREELPDNKDIHEMLAEIETAAQKLAEINQQLLALGRRGHYTMEPVDLNELFHQILVSQNLSKDIVLKEQFAQDLFLIKGGAAQLTRAFVNLIINASEAMNGRGILTITTENTYLEKPLAGHPTMRRGEYAQLKISDTGVGMADDVIENIFDPFFTTKRMDLKRGSGLGLSIVHGIIEDHNAYLTVDSKVGKGTAFTIYFPISRDLNHLYDNEVAEIIGGSERILVVDDDPIQRRVAGQLLKRLGYEVHVLSSGERAVKHVKTRPYDLLIMDMIMDGIDGVEAYRRILEFHPEQKAIILSGYAMSNRVEKALKLGAGMFVSKPITQKILAEAVRRELDKKSKRKYRLN